ncbi:hypothetical protein [uncultured Nostoc sp.]|uniref:hypothetical protein n=1 Tax=uncultured Nostoc sp. TaxID=340711 RepID=UPI0035CC7B78
MSSDGSYVVTGDETGNVQLWDVTNKKNIEINSDKNVKFKHEKAILSVTINAYKNQIKIVSGGADGKVLLWTVTVKNGQSETSNQKLF